MSGIAGIAHADGSPVDPALLGGMVAYLDFRGPDGRGAWSGTGVGLGHTRLAASAGSDGESQPRGLDDRYWITADARIDDRESLLRKLQAAGSRIDASTAGDAELILHAYGTWGEECVRHLLGDFAFAIWDASRRRLFCARDQLGVKPFYYARIGDRFVFSNTLNCVRGHPAISDGLNDLAVADYLAFDYNQDPASTIFNDVRRLPPAHALTWDGGEPCTRRYWTLPVDGYLRYRRDEEYVEHFRDVFRAAVSDRLRTDRIGVWMSGGLDSTSVAATAHELLSSGSASFDLRAYTVVYDRLIPDRERTYASAVADRLGIPIHFQIGDDYTPFERWDAPELDTPEPDSSPLAAIDLDQMRVMMQHSRVALTGYGGDPALFSSPSYFLDLARTGRPVRALTEGLKYVLTQRTLAGLGVRTLVRRRRRPDDFGAVYPHWFDPRFESRLDLRRRWREIHRPRARRHPWHPDAYDELSSPFWQYRFETCDPGMTWLPIEPRHPFFDVRVLDYLLSIPPVPWCVDKNLLRVAMRDALPERVRTRRKAPLGGDPERKLLSDDDGRPRCAFEPAAELGRYVDLEALSGSAWGQHPGEFRANLRPHCLNLWLHRRRPIRFALEQEKCHEVFA